jgi:hypothetical protein
MSIRQLARPRAVDLVDVRVATVTHQDLSQR